MTVIFTASSYITDNNSTLCSVIYIIIIIIIIINWHDHTTNITGCKRNNICMAQFVYALRRRLGHFLDSLARNNTKKRQLTLLVFLFASNVFEANHANTLWAKITAFARSSEPIWIKFGTLWAKCWGLAAADFGCDPRSIRQFERKPIFFCHANHEWFRRFPSNKFYDTWTQQRQSVSPCKTFVITSQWLQIAEIYFQMVPLRDV